MLYHANIGCELSTKFHEGILFNVVGLNKDIGPQKLSMSNPQTAQNVLKQTIMIFQDVREMLRKHTSST